MNTPSIPSYLSEANFRTYEHHLARGVAAFPEETKYTQVDFVDLYGKPLSGNTFSARFRDAITSLKRFNWETPVNVKKLWEITGQFSIAFDKDGCVWFRNKGKRGRPTDLTPEAKARQAEVRAAISDVDRTPWSNWTPEEVKAVCLLIHRTRMTGPILLIGPVPEDLIHGLESTHNVAFVFDQAGNQTIIT